MNPRLSRWELRRKVVPDPHSHPKYSLSSVVPRWPSSQGHVSSGGVRVPRRPGVTHLSNHLLDSRRVLRAG